MPIKYYTEEEYNDIYTQLRGTRSVIDATNKYFQVESRKRKEKSNDKSIYNSEGNERYHYIPYPTAVFTEACIHASKTILKNENICRPSFLEVGCGIGTNLIIAHEYFHVHGIEIEKETAEIAKCLFRHYNDYDDTIYLRDALKYKNYKEFDIIYFYTPFISPHLEIKLEKRIARMMKVGAYILAPSICDDIFTEKKFESFPTPTYSSTKLLKKIKK